MPRRGCELISQPEPLKKKAKVLIAEPSSLEVSFCDDEALSSGLIFTDVQQRKWRIGKPIGRGSFGRIYLASDEIDKEVTKSNARYVVKIEPHTNGPLFVEIHCLIRTALAAKVKEWRQHKKQKHFGMPVYIASGSFVEKQSNTKYRFLVLPRYDIDLQKIIARTKVLDLKNVLTLAVQILDVLEYLHGQGYTHSDIKSSNLMLGFDGGKYSKFAVPKPVQSFQKETREVAVLSGKQRKAKTGKYRSGNYYDDEDYVAEDSNEVEKDNRLARVKNKLRKILSEKDTRNLHRHHAFNLRQLSSYVNYHEDLGSSVCSDQSYQKLLDDIEIKRLDYASDKDRDKNINNQSVNEDIYKEAVLSQSSGRIYLLDYGLASKFLDSEGNHKDFGMDARKAHDGTLEYSSRDSHIGAHSRRSDLETLGYNLLDWLTGRLPWKTTEMLLEPDLVHAVKKNFMGNIKSLLKSCFKTEYYPQFMEKYLDYITSLDFTEKPDYDYCRSIFKAELAKMGCPVDKEISLSFNDFPPMSPVNRKKLCYSKRFGTKNTPPDFLARNGVKKASERENIYSLENDLKLEILRQTLNTSSDGIRKPCASRNFFISDADLVARLKKSLMPHEVLGKKLSPKNLRSKRNVQRKKGRKTHKGSIGKFGNFMGSARQFTWAEILAGNPEDIIRKERNNTQVDDSDFDDDNCKYRIRKLSNASEDSASNIHSPILQKDYLLHSNPTYAMKEVINKLKKNISNKNTKEDTDELDNFEGYTPIMIKIKKNQIQREAKEKLEAAKLLGNSKEKLSAEVVTRTTRSTKSKDIKVTKTPNKATKSSKKCTEKVVEIDCRAKELTKKKVNDTLTEKNDTLTEKRVTRSKATSSCKENVTKKVTIKKAVEIIKVATPPVEESQIAKKSQTKKKTRETAVPPNRRRLRSYKRNK